MSPFPPLPQRAEQEPWVSPPLPLPLLQSAYLQGSREATTSPLGSQVILKSQNCIPRRHELASRVRMSSKHSVLWMFSGLQSGDVLQALSPLDVLWSPEWGCPLSTQSSSGCSLASRKLLYAPPQRQAPTVTSSPALTPKPLSSSNSSLNI